MANPLRKTMVYLGLADEELEYDGAAPPPRPRPPQPVGSTPAAPEPRTGHPAASPDRAQAGGSAAK